MNDNERFVAHLENIYSNEINGWHISVFEQEHEDFENGFKSCIICVEDDFEEQPQQLSNEVAQLNLTERFDGSMLITREFFNVLKTKLEEETK